MAGVAALKIGNHMINPWDISVPMPTQKQFPTGLAEGDKFHIIDPERGLQWHGRIISLNVEGQVVTFDIDYIVQS